MDIESPITETLARDMCRHLETFAASITITPHALFCMDHALAEHLQNLNDHSDASVCRLRLESQGGKLTIEVQDNGKPYNILDHPAVDTSVPLLDRPVGGLGIHMIRRLVNEIHYASADGWNTTTFSKDNHSRGPDNP